MRLALDHKRRRRPSRPFAFAAALILLLLMSFAATSSSKCAALSAATITAARPAHSILSDWTWPPEIVIPLLLSAALYAAGAWRLRRNSRNSARPALQRLSVISFTLGWFSLAFALDSPIHEMGEQLFSVHMTQHEILVLISAPLLVLSRPLVPFLWAFPAPARQFAAAASRTKSFKLAWLAISAPLSAWLLHAAALWVWHAPALFDATLRSDPVHAAQHISFLGTGLLFWWALIHGHAGRLGYGGAVLYVFTTAIHTSVLGALLTFSSRPWYAPYAATAPQWHLTALEDQQLGGLIMWIPAGVILLAVTLLLLVKWMRSADERWQLSRTAELFAASAQPSAAPNSIGAPVPGEVRSKENLASRAVPLLCALAFTTILISGCSRLSAREERDAARVTGGGDARAGQAHIRKYGCYACHTIGGVPGASGLVGPSLNGIGNRNYIAGELANTPSNLMRWIQHPQQVKPGTVMPEMNVTEEDSRDIAAYLYTLH